MVEGESHHEADIGAAPGIDGLVVVADDGEIFVFASEEIGESVLGEVDVLVFVDEDVEEFFLIFFAD